MVDPKAIHGLSLFLNHKHNDLEDVGPDNHHYRLHTLDSTLDHTGVITDAQHGNKTTIPDAHHRKWSWADEQGWIRLIRVPYGKFRKDVNWTNPILKRGPIGAWDDTYMFFPCAIYRDKKFWVFYSGHDGSYYRIGVAYGSEPWSLTKSAKNPIIDIYDDRAYCCSVMFDEVDNKWKMWFLGRVAGVQRLCYAYADDPEGPWTIVGAVASTPDNFLSTQGIIRLGNMYWAPYKTNLADSPTYVMYSEDGDTWIEYGQILAKGAPGEWDDYLLGYNSSFWNMGVFYTLYYGRNVDGTIKAIGLSTHWNGFETFFKNPLNPVLEQGPAGAWDATAVDHPSLLMYEDKFYLYYAGFPSYEVGLAQIP